MLLGNYNQWNANPGRERGGVTNNHAFLKPSSLLTFFTQDNPEENRKKSCFNEGYRPPYGWVPPFEAGSLSSHNLAKSSLDVSGSIQGGKPASGSASITITADGNGGLIVSGSGSATITISATGTIQSIAAASGSATISISASAFASALASISGQANVTISASGVITAIGYLSGISTNQAEFSAEALAQAVWNAMLEDHDDTGTFGERLQKLLTTAKFIGLK